MALIGPGGDRRGIPGTTDHEQTEETPTSESEAASQPNATRRRRNFQRLRDASPPPADSESSADDLSEKTTAAFDRGAFGKSSSAPAPSGDSGSDSGGSNGSGNAIEDAVSGAENAVDQAVSGAQDVFGISAYRRSEQFSESKQQYEQAGPLGKFNTATKVGFDLLLDNPNASIQETTTDVIGTATGAESDEDVAQQFQRVDRGIGQTIEETVSGTPLDNPATDAVRTAGDLLIGDTIRTFVEAGTGIDTETGTTESQTGALDAFDIGLTIGTAGTGKAASTAVRSADDAVRGLRGVDELFSLGARASDETATAAGRGAQGTDDAADETLPVLYDDVAGGADEIAETTEKAGGGLADEVFDRVDDVASSAARTGSSVGRIASRAGRAGARAARRGAGSRTAKIAGASTAAGAGLVAGGAVVDSLSETGDRNRVEAGGAVFTIVDRFQPTKRFAGGTLYEVRRGEERLGYSVVLGRNEDRLLMLDRSGTRTTAPLTPEQFVGKESGGAAAKMAVFDTEEAARDAYFGDDPKSGETAGDTWLRAESIEQLEGGWTLSRQATRSGSDQRYFVVRAAGEQTEAMTSGGGVEAVAADAPLGTLPSFDSEEAARAAHQKWVAETRKSGEQTERAWTEWSEVDQAPPWYVYRRSRVEGQRQEFVIAGTRDGTTVYLAPGGDVVEEPHTYSSSTAVTDAIRAYFEAVESGDVSEASQPTGGHPSTEDVTAAAGEQSESSRDAGGVIGLVTEHPVVSISIVVVAIVAYHQMNGTLELPSVSDGGAMPTAGGT